MHPRIHFSLDGTFLPFEEISLRVVVAPGSSRIGPVRLTGALHAVPPVGGQSETWPLTHDALMTELRRRRSGAETAILHGDVVLHPSLTRDDIVAFEIVRRFLPFDFGLVTAAARAGTIRLSPQKLEQELGGPLICSFTAVHSLHGDGDSIFEEACARNTVAYRLPPDVLLIPAADLRLIPRGTAGGGTDGSASTKSAATRIFGAMGGSGKVGGGEAPAGSGGKPYGGGGPAGDQGAKRSGRVGRSLPRGGRHRRHQGLSEARRHQGVPASL